MVPLKSSPTELILITKTFLKYEKNYSKNRYHVACNYLVIITQN